MAGGSGERFWPLSRPDRPKQLLRLTHPDRNMLEEALHRVESAFLAERTYIATSSLLKQAIVDAGIWPEDKILAEPVRRNTLGAQCWIVSNLLAAGLGSATLAVLTSDHMIGEPDRFVECVEAAMAVAESSGCIVTLGIAPNRPETGYGYIEEDAGSETIIVGSKAARRALSFREKPSQSTAESFLEAGSFLWNSGMFFFTIPAFLSELERAHPKAHHTTLGVAAALEAGETALAATTFEALPSISVNYAVMERAENVMVLRADFAWDDVGAWDALDRTRTADAHGNVVEGAVLMVDTHDCIALGLSPDQSIGLLGLRDMVVVACGDAVLVCHKRDAQRVRLLAQLHDQRSSGPG